MGEHTGVRGGTRPSAERSPAIAGPIFSSVRTMLVDRGCWDEVLAAFIRRRPEDAAWIGGSTWSLWVDLDRHVAMVEAAAEVIGIEGVSDLGRNRVAAELHSGLFATIVRSWLRTFAGQPGHLLRVAPYLWRAGFRGCGKVTVEEAQESLLRYRVVGAPKALRESEAWRALLSGFAHGLFDLAQVQGDIHIGPMGDHPDDVEMVGRWTPLHRA
jgi:hypothetical protein